MKGVKKSGFTLIEILVVIGLIAILAAIVLIAINPARQFAQARNSQRQSNVETILNALGQNLADNKGISSCSGISSATTTIGTNISVTSAHGGYPIKDLSSCLSNYISNGIPMDPSYGTAADTGYDVSIDSTGRYLVCAQGYNESSIVPNPGVYCLRR